MSHYYGIIPRRGRKIHRVPINKPLLEYNGWALLESEPLSNEYKYIIIRRNRLGFYWIYEDKESDTNQVIFMDKTFGSLSPGNILTHAKFVYLTKTDVCKFVLTYGITLPDEVTQE